MSWIHPLLLTTSINVRFSSVVRFGYYTCNTRIRHVNQNSYCFCYCPDCRTSTYSAELSAWVDHISSWWTGSVTCFGAGAAKTTTWRLGSRRTTWTSPDTVRTWRVTTCWHTPNKRPTRKGIRYVSINNTCVCIGILQESSPFLCYYIHYNRY